MMTRVASRFFAASTCAVFALSASAQLRVATWNISNYGGGRTADIQTAVYGVFEGRSLAPDVIIGQEFLSSAAVTSFQSALNTALGSPGDWAAATFVDGPDTDSAFFYRTSRVSLVSSLVVAIGSSSTSNQPRHTMRYDFRPVGYTAAEATIGAYSVHLKAGDGSTDQARRLVETQRIRDNAEGLFTGGAGLPAGYSFLVAGDFNIQTSSQAAYQELIGNQSNNAGRFFDPIATPGSWNNNGSYRIVHTQDPAGAGGMDDRHDQVLVSNSLIDGGGLSYIGNHLIPYSTTTWNDPNHSYRAWGNDGSSYNLTMAVAGNTMVGPAIAQALVNCANGAGHLPVVLNLRVPAVAESTASIDFGTVSVGDPASQTLFVWNDADVAKWSAIGIDDLNYSLASSAGFTAPGGSYIDAPAGGTNGHTITMDTSTPGLKAGTITITSDAPDQPTLIVSITGEVIDDPACPSDVNGDGESDVLDFLDYMDAFGTCENQPAPCGVGPVDADFNGDTSVDVLDFLDFFDAFGTGCP
jgi:endonuclease/exonuclease/phosphatase family metal-dependent hydrolase